jgi:Tol biopolymer transport system component
MKQWMAIVGIVLFMGAGIPVLADGAGVSNRTGRIVFCSNRSGPWRIWMMNADGTQAAQLSKDDAAGHDVDPVFNPDGSRILFTSTRGGATGIWQMKTSGSGLERICDGDQAEWSPDGTAIAFRRKGRILTRQLADGKEQTISPEDWQSCSGPSWSPGGRTLAFARLQEAGNALFIVAVSGGKPTKVYDKEGACEAHWSPDGKLLVYETETHICTIQPDGTENRLITYYGGVQRYARWSPDGKNLVFCQGASEKGPWELYVVPSRGGNPARLTQGASDMYADWR